MRPRVRLERQHLGKVVGEEERVIADVRADVDGDTAEVDPAFEAAHQQCELVALVAPLQLDAAPDVIEGEDRQGGQALGKVSLSMAGEHLPGTRDTQPPPEVGKAALADRRHHVEPGPARATASRSAAATSSCCASVRSALIGRLSTRWLACTLAGQQSAQHQAW